VAGAAIIGGIALFHELAYDLISENEKITCAAFDACVDAFNKKDGIFQKIIVISSSMVFENVSSHPTKECDLFSCPPPSSTYGFQKLSTEYFAKGAYIQYGLPYTIVRPFNAVGIGEKRSNIGREIYSGNIKLCMSHVIPDLIHKIYMGQNPLHILGNGNQIRHYTYAGDLANSIVECIFNPNALNNDFNLSTDTGYSVLEVAEIIWKKMGRNDTIKFKNDEPFNWDVLKRVPDTSKAKDILGIKCNTTFEESLNEIIPWVIEKIKLGEI
jgi:nucleoside-diphosphate-sugar epimerase